MTDYDRTMARHLLELTASLVDMPSVSFDEARIADCVAHIQNPLTIEFAPGLSEHLLL